MDCSLPDSSAHGFSRQKCCSGLPLPSPGGLSDSGIKPTSPALAVRFFTTKPPRKPPRTTTITYGGCKQDTVLWSQAASFQISLHPSTAAWPYTVAYGKMGIKLTLLLKIKLNKVCKVRRLAPGEWFINIRNLHHYHHLLHKMSDHMVEATCCHAQPCQCSLINNNKFWFGHSFQCLCSHMDLALQSNWEKFENSPVCEVSTYTIIHIPQATQWPESES